MHRRYFKILIGALLAVFLMAGCGGGGGGSVSAQTGTLSVSLTDAAAGGFDEVNVTISKVRVHMSADAEEDDGGWSEIVLEPARKINLLDLQNGILENLGETPLPVGHYTQLRLVLVSNDEEPLANSVVLSDDPTSTATPLSLVTPSAAQSGIKLINQFDVAAGERVDLVIDFDALKSVVKRGNGTYALKPVIKVTPTTLNGITGFVDTALLDSNVVMVTAQVEGEIIRSTTLTQTGEFFLARLETGDYDVVITADGHATAVIAGVPVETETSVTGISTADEPISLPESETRNISGTVTLDQPSETEVAAYVAAKQSITEGVIVTVKDDSVSLTDSPVAYELMLPIAAPLLAQYGAGPIVFDEQDEQTDVAGKYIVEASANGYTPQESEVLDISTEDKTKDFGNVQKVGQTFSIGVFGNGR